MKHLTTLFASVLLSFTFSTTVMADEATAKPLIYEELPDMSTPRLGHASFITANGDIVVVGGHTTGFRLTSTAERLHDGEWESLSITNPHDGAAVVTLPDGRVLVGGGFSSGSGVGQSKVCDIYNPETNTFSTTSGFKVNRAFCNAVATGIDNNILVSGNWYNNDDVFELWDGNEFTTISANKNPMNAPHMVSDGEGVVFVFGTDNNYGSKGNVSAYMVNTVENRVEEFTIPELDGYWVQPVICGMEPATSMTADGNYIFLAYHNENKVYELFRMDATTGIVSQVVNIPAYVPETDIPLSVRSGIIVNKNRNEAYVCGEHQNTDGTWAAVVVTYNLTTHTTTVFHGGNFSYHPINGSWALQQTTGNIILTGGSVSNNFDAVATAFVVTPFDGTDGISSVSSVQSSVTGRYSIDGRRLSAPVRDINILRTSDGVRKVLVK